ncbi:MAG TPA: methyltransferase domain-containing protein, partial [Candidatus Acidoferrales bacterium]|nr:methyltransferase domain-containing protein [Candidatus Acidoferrales bacterium]
MQNAFGYQIPTIKQIVTDPSIKSTVSCMLIDVLTYLGLPSHKAEELIAQCLQTAISHDDICAYEEEAHNILEAQKVAQLVPEKLALRADLMYAQIAPYLVAGNVLDYGCGDGQVSELIAKNIGQQVTLADVYQHRHIKETGLSFTLFKQGEKTPFPEAAFDNILALTVFHHSSNPTQSIHDVARLTKPGGRVIVVESVYSVDGHQLSMAMQKKIDNYLSLSGEQHRVNIFFDHFYNRVLHYSKDAATKVNVPFNFNTPDNWKQLFAHHGLAQEKI